MNGEGSGGITQRDGLVAASVDYTLQAQNNNKQQVVPPIGVRRKLLRSGQKSRQQKIQDNPKTKGDNNYTRTDKVSTEKQYKPN